MEEPHYEVSNTFTFVSLELLESGPYAVKGKNSLSMQLKILSWMSMMIPCVENQRPLTVGELVGGICDLMARGENAHDKGRT